MKFVSAIQSLLIGLGEDIDREGLKDTPKRVSQFYTEFLSPSPLTTAAFAAEGYDEMIVQSGMAFYSLCEHHLLPFFGTATIGYLPATKIVGLSKLPRILEHFSHRLQNQERLTIQTATYIERQLRPQGVGVIIQARHLCMEMRGVRQSTGQTTTSCLRGLMRSRPKSRAEFLKLAGFS